MKVVGTYEGDSIAHVILPFDGRTICGLYVTGYPVPSDYAAPCSVCAEAVERLEALMHDIE